MKSRLLISTLFASLWLCFSSALAFGGVEQISEKEFRDLAQELSLKVNLFKAGWEKDPQAEFYGGTTRDYLYWLKGQFQNAHNKDDAKKIAAKLQAMTAIDVRDFIIGDSDVDIISAGKNDLKADDFGVRKIDFQSTDILNPETEAGRSEKLQGYIPAEKIRLAKDGFHPTGLGDGIQEIYKGTLSVHFASPEDFAKSRYAIEGINHPILLALRYLRLQGINYYRSYGKDFPDAAKLAAGMDEKSAEEVRKLIHDALYSGELKPYLEKSRFLSWINGAIQKSFRSYTNPTAALELMKKFGVDKLHEAYPEIEPVNQYVFAKFRDSKLIQAALKKYRVNPSEFYESPQKYFSDGKIYHGTKTEEAFRGIVFQGALPSTGGLAGGGLYGVAEQNKIFSEEWGGSKDRLLSLKVKPEAKVVDIVNGEGKRVWEAYLKVADGPLVYDTFADTFGVDLIRYPYDPEAFVVKNAAVLTAPEGVYRSVMPFHMMMEKAASEHDPAKILQMLSVNSLTLEERELVWRASAVSTADMRAYLMKTAGEGTLENIISLSYWRDRPELSQIPWDWVNLKNAKKSALGMAWLKAEPKPSIEYAAKLDQLMVRDPPLSAELTLELLTYLWRAPGKLPHITEYTLSHLENYPSTASNHTTFLRSRELSDAQKERVFQIIKNLNDKNEGAINNLAPILALNNYRKEEVKQLWLSHSLSSRGGILAQTVTLEELRRNYPLDVDVTNAIYPFLERNFTALGQNSVLSKIAALAKDDPRTKSLLLEKLRGKDIPDSQMALHGLGELDLNDAELAEFFEKVDFTTQYAGRNAGLNIRFLDKQKEPLGPQATKALLALQQKSDGSDESRMLRLRIAKKLKQSPHRGMIAEEIAREFALPLEQLQQKDQYKLGRLVQLTLSDAVPFTPDLREAIFSAHEKLGDRQKSHALELTDFAPKLLETDPSYSDRMQALFLKNRQYFTRPSELWAIAEHMGKIKAEFRDYLRQHARSFNGTNIPTDQDVWAISQLSEPEKPRIPFEKWNGSAEASRLKVDLALRADSKGFSANADVIKLIEQDPNQELIRDYLNELLRAKEPIEKVFEGARGTETALIGDIIRDAKIPVDKRLTDSILYNLRHYFDSGYAGKYFPPLLESLPLEEPAVAGAIQELFTENKIMLVNEEDVESIASRMPGYSDEFRALLMKETGKNFQSQVVPHKLPLADCAGSFNALIR